MDGLQRERGLRDVEARLLLAQDVFAHEQRLRHHATALEEACLGLSMRRACATSVCLPSRWNSHRGMYASHQHKEKKGGTCVMRGAGMALTMTSPPGKYSMTRYR